MSLPGIWEGSPLPLDAVPRDCEGVEMISSSAELGTQSGGRGSVIHHSTALGDCLAIAVHCIERQCCRVRGQTLDGQSRLGRAVPKDAMSRTGVVKTGSFSFPGLCHSTDPQGFSVKTFQMSSGCGSELDGQEVKHLILRHLTQTLYLKLIADYIVCRECEGADGQQNE